MLLSDFVSTTILDTSYISEIMQHLYFCDADFFDLNTSITQSQKPNNVMKNWAKDCSKHFSKDDIQMINRFYKKMPSNINYQRKTS